MRQWLIARSDEINGLRPWPWGPLARAQPGVAVRAASDDIAFVRGWGDGVVLLGRGVALGLLLGAWFYGGLAVASQPAPGGPLADRSSAPRAVVDVLGLVAFCSGRRCCSACRYCC